MADIITLGELLVDLTQSGSDENGNGIFTAYPGGAPANVAVAAARLGASTAFIGKVGEDAFGRSLAETLKKEGIDVSGLCFDKEVPTTLAIVSVDESGERDFSFYRKPGADTRLEAGEAIAAIDSQSSRPYILHVGSLSLTDSPAKEACIEAVKHANEKGMLISYDPNYREALWSSEDVATEEMKSLMPYADILKVSDEEMLMLTGTDDLEEGSRILQGMGRAEDAEGIYIVMVTLGPDGVFVRCGDKSEQVDGVSTDVADTNGAGDTFLGAVLSKLAQKINDSREAHKEAEAAAAETETEAADEPEELIGWDELKEILSYANRAASFTCSGHGAIPAMPHAADIE